MSKYEKPQSYYEAIKMKFGQERDVRLSHRPEGTAQFTSDLDGELNQYAVDPFAGEVEAREPINDQVEVLFIGGGFSALLTSAQLRKKGLESIRIVERGTDVGGAWYWNRYPGIACDVESYDYLPLLDEMDYVPVNKYSRGAEIYSHCQAIAKKYDLYDMAVFNTTITSTVWDEDQQMWHLKTDRGDHMRAQFVICANGTLSKPKLSKISGMENFSGPSFHTSRWDYNYTGQNLENLHNKVVGIIGTGASAVQVVPELGKTAKDVFVFQRTPSSIDIREEGPTDPNWARSLAPGWQGKRREEAIALSEHSLLQRMSTAQEPTATGTFDNGNWAIEKAKMETLSQVEKIQAQENANIDYMMGIHKRIDAIVKDKATADALKPWYMFMCKRPCFHNEYLPAFNLPNVHLIDTQGEGITQIKPEGPHFGGVDYKLDLLIYATGFEIQKTGTYNQIIGKGGVDLNDKYSDGIRTTYGIHSNGYPNLFIMGGYQASYQFNLTDMLQAQCDHIAECIDYVRKNGYHAMEPTEEVEENWVQEVIKSRGKTSWNQDCTPGYYNFEGEKNRRQDGNYNGTFRSYVQHMKAGRGKMTGNFSLTTKEGRQQKA
ncbi:MAG: cyclohexanone monooxygenase [Halioglobus sp.]|jgi:cyclohexanone monooxygenase